MSYKVVLTRRYKKSIKRIRQLPGFRQTTLNKVVLVLAAGDSLDKKYRDHKLKGNFRGYRECHIAPDILLLYKINNDTIVLSLVDIGNHSQLFK